MESPLNPHEEQWTVSGPIRPVAPEERIQELELNAHATVADAAPLGLAAFAATTFTLGSALAGWQGIVSPGGVPGVAGFVAAIPLLIIFGGIAQFIAAMWAFRKGSTFWATFLGVFGSLYATLGLSILLAGATGIPVGATTSDVATGVGVAMFAFIAGYLTWAAMGESSVMVWVAGFLTASLALLSAGFFIGGNFLIFWASGYAAIASALGAFYASAAIVINSTMQREVLPY
ncbi:MAG: GPR1/FUN34/YaaH family transporter [Chloroflexi bacterium]|nr:GPR1/FUN34/YaaH family transporter [Chloroflexota bacterium]